MLNQKKVEIFLAKFHKSLAKQFLEVALNKYTASVLFCQKTKILHYKRSEGIFFCEKWKKMRTFAKQLLSIQDWQK